MAEAYDPIAYIWVPGTEQPEELLKFASTLTSSTRNVGELYR
jgi:hypothetical protein